MNQNKLESLEKVHTRILHWGIFLDIFVPVAFFFLTILVREKLFIKHDIKNTEFLFYVLLADSVTEILNL